MPFNLFSRSESPAIYYVAEDVVKPSWGTATAYHHVQMLNAMGHKAFMLHHKQSSKLQWVNIPAPIRFFDQNIQFKPSEILVVAEVLCDADYILTIPCRKIAHVQNAFFLVGPKKIKDPDFSRLGYEKALVPMPHLKDVMEKHHRLPAEIVPYFLPEYFFGQEKKERKKQILFYSKFDNIDFNILKQVLCDHLDRPQYKEWKAVELVNMTHEQTAAAMHESMFFVNINCYEAFNTSVPEAMAAGCINLCYEAFGGKDYLKNKENAYVFSNNNVYPLLDQLFYLIDNFEKSQNELAEIRKNAHATAAQYKKENTRHALEKFYSGILKR
jgi:hypothetical protein